MPPRDRQDFGDSSSYSHTRVISIILQECLRFEIPEHVNLSKVKRMGRGGGWGVASIIQCN